MHIHNGNDLFNRKAVTLLSVCVCVCNFTLHNFCYLSPIFLLFFIAKRSICVPAPALPRKHQHQSSSPWLSLHISHNQSQISHCLLNPHPLTCLKACLDCTHTNTQNPRSSLGCMNIWVAEVMGRGLRLWVEATGQAVAKDEVGQRRDR